MSSKGVPSSGYADVRVQGSWVQGSPVKNDLVHQLTQSLPTNDNQPIKYNIFAVQKFVQCGVGDVKSAKKLRNGTVLIEVSTKEQAQKALNMTTWFDTPITVTAH